MDKKREQAPLVHCYNESRSLFKQINLNGLNIMIFKAELRS